jgi:hypothetical protein
LTSKDFRVLALELAGAFESEHMSHPDFRRNGKVFATLGHPAEGWAMVKLTATQQRYYVGRALGAFQPASGAWGRSGSTMIQLAKAKKPLVKAALSAAFRNMAPRNNGAASSPRIPPI